MVRLLRALFGREPCSPKNFEGTLKILDALRNVAFELQLRRYIDDYLCSHFCTRNRTVPFFGIIFGRFGSIVRSSCLTVARKLIVMSWFSAFVSDAIHLWCTSRKCGLFMCHWVQTFDSPYIPHWYILFANIRTKVLLYIQHVSFRALCICFSSQITLFRVNPVFLFL